MVLMKLHPIRGNPPDIPEGSSVTITGYVDDRQYKNDSYILILKDAYSQESSHSRDSLLVYLENEPPHFKKFPAIGSRLTVRGKMSLFPEATNPGQFDLKNHYHIRGIHYRLFHGDILSYGKKHDILREQLFRLRLRIEEVYDSLLPGDDSGVLKAMILGDRTDLDLDIKTLYRKSGIAHALAISGVKTPSLSYG